MTPSVRTARSFSIMAESSLPGPFQNFQKSSWLLKTYGTSQMKYFGKKVEMSFVPTAPYSTEPADSISKVERSSPMAFEAWMRTSIRPPERSATSCLNLFRPLSCGESGGKVEATLAVIFWADTDRRAEQHQSTEQRNHDNANRFSHT